MRTVALETLFKQVWFLCTGKSEMPDTDDYPGILGSLDLALSEVWEQEEWTDLINDEQRQFRDSYNAATIYAAPTLTSATEVLYWPKRTYYQALRASTGNTPVNIDGTVNTAYWYICQSKYSGADWTDGTAYAVGIVVRNPANNRFYACHTAHTASGSLDDTKFGVLTPFDRYIAYHQTIDGVVQTPITETFLVTDENIRITQQYREVPWRTSSAGIQILERYPSVWIQFRRERPVLTGANLDTAASYVAGGQAFFTPENQLGNMYDCLAAAGPGQTPDTNPELWQVVELPLIFQGYVVYSAYAKWLKSDGQPDKAEGAMVDAGTYLQLEINKLHKQTQNQNQPMRLRTY